MDMPAIGTWIEVTTDYSKVMKAFAGTVQRVHTKRGKVVPKDEWEADNVFCILTDDHKTPIRSISMDYVTRIVNLETNSEFDTSVAKNESKANEDLLFDITGSKGNTYVVQKKGFSWFCNCPAGSNKRQCKHVAEAKAKYEATQV